MASVLDLLIPDEYVSGEAVSQRLGLSRAAVWKQIESLRGEGWIIESGGKRGYRLVSGDSLKPRFWQQGLTTHALGLGAVEYAETLTSTNTVLKRMALEGAPHGSLALCERQTAGRGRMGREWVSEKGVGLWVSVLLRPTLHPAQAPLLTFAAALAMRQAVLESCGLDCGIKWPNDLVAGGKKVCGILLEVSAEPDRLEYVVAGTGLNVLRGAVPPGLEAQAASVEDFVPLPRRRDILTRYLAALEIFTSAVESTGFAGIEAAYREASATLGRPVRVSGVVELTGVAEALDASGALLVRDGDGQLHRVLAGDVSVRGLMGYV
ncbi:MAG: biotin--[Clostridia bacterium]|nr:biotin--[acetyl-CoA-carboxylase] ligase [Clostridia bacterium]